jgi:predicted amidohydrolase
MLICYDRQLPEPARILALKGAQILLVPSFGSYTDENGWNTVLMRTRAYENGVPVVFTHPFQSLLISHNGELRAVGGSNEIVYYEVDTSPERYQNRFSNRRPETYQRLTSYERRSTINEPR